METRNVPGKFIQYLAHTFTPIPISLHWSLLFSCLFLSSVCDGHLFTCVPLVPRRVLGKYKKLGRFFFFQSRGSFSLIPFYGSLFLFYNKYYQHILASYFWRWTKNTSFSAIGREWFNSNGFESEYWQQQAESEI